MKITAIPPHAYQLTRYGLVNCFLVREPDDFTLIDANLKGSAILAAASAAGAPIRLLLTHAHVDHVGSVDALAAAIPGLLVAASDRSLPLLRIPPDKFLPPPTPKEKSRAAFPASAPSPTRSSPKATLSAHSAPSPPPATSPANSLSSTSATEPSMPATPSSPSSISA